jgi:integrase
MATHSLHRTPKSKYWYVSYRLPHRDKPDEFRQYLRSTKQVTKAEAEKAARVIVAAAEKEAGAGTDKGRAIYAVLQEAAQLAESGRLNLAMGTAFVGKMIEASGGGDFKRYTVRAWLQHWLDGKTTETAKPGGRGKTRGYSAATHLRYSGVVNQLLDWLPEEKQEGDILSLSTDDLRRWRDSLSKEGRSAATVNDAVKTIRTALNAARRNGAVLSNVADAVAMLTEAESIRAVFTLDDLNRLLAASKGDWRGVILTGWFTGASLRDITNLRWRQVDLSAGAISYTRRKSGKAVEMPIHEDLAAWLTELPATDDPEAFLFPSLAGKATAGKSGLSMAFKAIMAKAGIEGETEEAKGEAGRTRNALSFHCLRHSFISGLANAGIGVEMRQALAGQSSAEVNMIYTHREIAPLREAMKSLPGLNGKEGKA